jgi:iduronate 2-sulfatase
MRHLWGLVFILAMVSGRAHEYQLFLLGGQSNMDGRGNVSELPKELSTNPEILLFYKNEAHTSKDWVSLQGGYSIKPGYKGELPSATFGPEIGFGLNIAKGLPGQHIALLKACKGGTSLSKDWVPGIKGDTKSQGPLYRNFLEAFSSATQALKEKGHTFVIKGMIWHQGESDAAKSSEEYKKMLTEFIARVREDLNLPNLPFVIGEVYDNGKRDSIRMAQQAVAQSVPNTGFISAKDTKTWDNGTHFDAASQILLGERFAAEMLRLLKAK